MSFEPLTLEPSGDQIAGWNGATFDPASDEASQQVGVIQAITQNWNFSGDVAGEFATTDDVDIPFILEGDAIPYAEMDINSGADCARAETVIYGGVFFEQCGIGSSGIGAILFGSCAITFNEGVLPPIPPIPPPTDRCPPIELCTIVPGLEFLQEVSE